jgi:hypothetical protein
MYKNSFSLSSLPRDILEFSKSPEIHLEKSGDAAFGINHGRINAAERMGKTAG